MRPAAKALGLLYEGGGHAQSGGVGAAILAATSQRTADRFPSVAVQTAALYLLMQSWELTESESLPHACCIT